MNWLSVISSLVTFAAGLMQFINANRERTSGWTEAVNSALKIQAEQMTAAADEMNNAEKLHASDPSDGAFDPQFKRSD